MPLHSLAAFLAAFLLFSLQLAAGKALLPSAGGSAALFTLLLALYTLLLLAGYLLVHAAFRDGAGRRGRRAAAALHLLAAASFWFGPALTLDLPAGVDPYLAAPLAVLRALGLPLLALSTVSPLLQRVLADGAPADRAYPLSAASNTGSLAGVLAYPLLVERWLDLDAQAAAARLLLLLLALLLSRILLAAPSPEPRPAPPAEGGAPRPAPPRPWIRWTLYAASGAALLPAFTARMCRDIAAVPFLFALPLAAYLLSWVAAFRDLAGEGRNRRAIASAACLAVLACALALDRTMFAPLELAFDACALLVFCLTLHGEAVRLRPAADGLTAFHLAIAGGGALGTLAVAAAAPLVFNDHFEFPLSLLLFALLFAESRLDLRTTRRPLGRTLALFFTPFTLVVAAGLLAMPSDARRSTLEKSRSFHGTLKVARNAGGEDAWRAGIYLFSGRTIHGAALAAFPGRPSGYYAPLTGVGRCMKRLLARGRPVRVGVIGLGAGTLAAYARPGDTFRFYEIDPAAERLARRWFPFLPACRGSVEVIFGDARRSLEREPPQGFDLLVADAFSGDAVPVHFLTREAFSLYRRHLAPGGLLALNLSNIHLDLLPVAAGGAVSAGFAAGRLRSAEDPDTGAFVCDWAVATDAAGFFEDEGAPFERFTPEAPRPVLWTDRFSDPLSLMKF